MAEAKLIATQTDHLSAATRALCSNGVFTDTIEYSLPQPLNQQQITEVINAAADRVKHQCAISTATGTDPLSHVAIADVAVLAPEMKAPDTADIHTQLACKANGAGHSRRFSNQTPFIREGEDDIPLSDATLGKIAAVMNRHCTKVLENAAPKGAPTTPQGSAPEHGRPR